MFSIVCIFMGSFDFQLAESTQFFMIVITGSLFQLFGPLPQANSKYYSCKLILGNPIDYT